jgi:S1-C subfamily serine protease
MAQLYVVDSELSFVGRGSGSVVTADGLVLTNYHVVADADAAALANPEGLVLIGLSRDAREAPSNWTIGAVVAADSGRDLAVLRILYTADGRGIRGWRYATLPWGDSDALELGEPLVGLGYPTIGGSTLTLVQGSMAGFSTDEQGVRFGKTDSELLPGSSGGAVLNRDGALVGVITRVTRDDETQGRLGYFLLFNEARALIREAQAAPLSRPDIDWLLPLAANLQGS